MANAPSHDIIIDQGSDYELDLTLELNGTPLDLQYWTIYATYRESYNSPNYVEFTTQKLDEGTGYFRLAMPAYKSDTLTKNGYYDVEIHGDDGQIIRVLQGAVVVSRSVTTQR